MLFRSRSRIASQSNCLIVELPPRSLRQEWRSAGRHRLVHKPLRLPLELSPHPQGFESSSGGNDFWQSRQSSASERLHSQMGMLLHVGLKSKTGIVHLLEQERATVSSAILEIEVSIGSSPRHRGQRSPEDNDDSIDTAMLSVDGC